MNIWKHCILSQRKFGGQPEDYFEIHKFIDSSKLFLFHMKHRILLHNLFGVELCIEMFGDYVKNSDDKTVLVRDISVEHCKEDLSGFIPTLNDWFDNFQLPDNFVIPSFTDNELTSFVQRPYLRSGVRASLMITCSNFGVYLVEKFYGVEKALLLANSLPTQQTVQNLLNSFKFTHTWQVFPDRKELVWLQQNEHNS
jgi:hypothetical protein